MVTFIQITLTTMLKLDARIEYRDKRNLLTTEKVSQLSEDIFKLFFQTFDVSQFKCIHFFKSIHKLKEVNTDNFATTILNKFPNTKLATSVSDINSTLLKHYVISKETIYKENLFRIPEPQNGVPISEHEVELVLIPMFVFDKEGHRVGYGKGYYDRFLRELDEKVIKVGVNFFGPIDKIIDSDEFDVALDYCITPDKVYKF